MIPVFRAADVERAVSPHEAYDAVRGAFEAHARATWSMPSKVYVSNYPAGDFACFNYCTSAYDRGKSCSSANKAQECRTESERCRAQCQ